MLRYGAPGEIQGFRSGDDPRSYAGSICVSLLARVGNRVLVHGEKVKILAMPQRDHGMSSRIVGFSG